jgi:flagellar protein FlbD
MIALTSVSGEAFFLNCDLIYRIDEAYDTIITLSDGQHIRVSEPASQIVERIVDYKRKIYHALPEVGK